MSIKELYYKALAKQLAKPQGLIGRSVAKKLNKSNKGEYDFVVKEISNYSDSAILEIGFCNGVLLNQLANRFDNQYFGVDISKDMVKTATLINKEFINNGKMKLYQADIEEMPFHNETFDIIYTCNTVYFWRDAEKAISEIKRVLKPNGKFMNVAMIKEGFENNPISQYGFSKYTLTELCDMLKSIGADVEVKDVNRDNKFAVIATKN